MTKNKPLEKPEARGTLKELLSRSFNPRDFRVQLIKESKDFESDGRCIWYDEFQITYGKNEAEEALIKEHLNKVLSEKVGFLIRIVVLLEDHLGQRVAYFRREHPKVLPFPRFKKR